MIFFLFCSYFQAASIYCKSQAEKQLEKFGLNPLPNGRRDFTYLQYKRQSNINSTPKATDTESSAAKSNNCKFEVKKELLPV